MRPHFFFEGIQLDPKGVVNLRGGISSFSCCIKFGFRSFFWINIQILEHLSLALFP